MSLNELSTICTDGVLVNSGGTCLGHAGGKARSIRSSLEMLERVTESIDVETITQCDGRPQKVRFMFDLERQTDEGTATRPKVRATTVQVDERKL